MLEKYSPIIIIRSLGISFFFGVTSLVQPRVGGHVQIN